MSGRLTRSGYESLIVGDLAWLRAMPDCLEQRHVIAIVAASVEHEYPSAPRRPCPGTAHEDAEVPFASRPCSLDAGHGGRCASGSGRPGRGCSDVGAVGGWSMIRWLADMTDPDAIVDVLEILDGIEVGTYAEANLRRLAPGWPLARAELARRARLEADS